MGKRANNRQEPKIIDEKYKKNTNARLKINFFVISFAKDVEKATEPFMEKARQIKEEVNIATSDLKQVVDKQNETFLNKTGNKKKLKE